MSKFIAGQAYEYSLQYVAVLAQTKVAHRLQLLL